VAARGILAKIIAPIAPATELLTLTVAIVAATAQLAGRRAGHRQCTGDARGGD